ncbi:universal stress protein UspA [Dyella solisilvae]|uniref:Universal stress protein UspA n=1 Tax=Dyella solisilvae TaxID=1920168 RepID=A0A370KAK6_9GAMM|nr:universal stress protein [Dyella solisilvae]RDI99688.1 universal stress protein UspA [Dyella solisilvae]
MYRHLLVPLDDTEHSIETVSRAVHLARTLGARVSFLQVQAEAPPPSTHVEHPDAYQDHARALLARAESAARALGVPCDSHVRTDQPPHEAILDVAHKAGCDLIVAGARGQHDPSGGALDGAIFKVLAQGELPVLVDFPRTSAKAYPVIGIIRDEHRSLAAVLHAWLHHLATCAQQGCAADVALMRSMVRYIMEFPVALHHPKEHEYLFRRLRDRTAVVHAELDELERQHERDHAMVEALADLIGQYETGAATLAMLHQAVERYTQFMWDHTGREEGVILPAAQHYLSDADWSEIHAAFAGNLDPRFTGETEAEFKQLFARIVELTPP